MQLPTTFEALIAEAVHHELYKKLIDQLNKDFILANVDYSCDTQDPPKQLINSLHEAIFKLIQDKFADYLNLLYIIDVSEKKVKLITETDALKVTEQVTFLILQREWQKVWYKNKY